MGVRLGTRKCITPTYLQQHEQTGNEMKSHPILSFSIWQPCSFHMDQSNSRRIFFNVDWNNIRHFSQTLAKINRDVKTPPQSTPHEPTINTSTRGNVIHYQRLIQSGKSIFIAKAFPFLRLINTDLPGRLPKQSSQGNSYI